MQPISSYETNEGFLRVLLQGPPGGGKTTTACQLPRPWIADCDLNLAGPLRYLRSQNLTLPVGYDTIDRDEKGVEVHKQLRFTRLAKVTEDAAKNPDIDTMVFDSGTKISDYIMDHVLKQQGKTQMEMQSWGFYLAFWKQFIGSISTAKKHIVFIVHEKVEKDEIDQALKYFINLPGQIKDVIGALFTDVWRAEASEKPGMPPTTEYLIRTSPNYRFALKNSLQLPSLFKFSWPTIAAKLVPPTTQQTTQTTTQ
jgi:hypothetical protein